MSVTRRCSFVASVTIVAAGLALATQVAPVVLAEAATAASRSCETRSSRTVVANSLVRVYSVGRGARELFACWQRTGRRRSLGGFDSVSGGVNEFRLAGRYVAYNEFIESSGGNGGQMHVLNVATGRQRRSSEYSRDSFGAADVEVTTRGSVAWIEVVVRGSQRTYRVRKLDRNGETTLDEGVDIAATSLALAQQAVYWTRGGQPMSADLVDR